MNNTPQQISDEMLFAYVDNELDAAGRALVEAAMARDPAIAARVERQRSLRALLGEAYAPVLKEPVPERLAQAVNAPAQQAEQRSEQQKARVLKLVSSRKQRERAAAPAEDRPAANDWTWKHWGGMAACLVVGVFAGRSAWLANATSDIANDGGRLVARGELGHALSTQLASTQGNEAPVRIGVSYRSRGEEFCRSFAIVRSGTGGLACRKGDEWELRVVAQERVAAGTAGNLRMAATPVPPAVLKTIDEQIQGQPLDAQAEKAAMGQGWKVK